MFYPVLLVRHIRLFQFTCPASADTQGKATDDCYRACEEGIAEDLDITLPAE